LGFSTELKLFSEQGTQLIGLKEHYFLPELYTLRYITPLDALLHQATSNTAQRCLRIFSFGRCKAFNLEPIAPVAQQFEPYQLKVLNQEPFDPLMVKLGQKLYSMFDNSLVAKFQDNSTLRMDPINLGYTDGSLFGGNEFLMTKQARYGNYSLALMMEQRGMKSIYGRDTLKVLEEIGWSTRRNSGNIRIQESQEAKNFLESLEYVY
jgi:hypothetical protein